MKNLTSMVLIIIMISLVTGLYAEMPQRCPQQQEAIDLIRSMRFAPVPGRQTTRRTLALTEYIEQDYWGEWENNTKVIIEYDSQLRPLNVISQYWYAWEEFWQNSNLEEATYSPDGKPLEVTEKWWDGMYWNLDSRKEFSWDGNRLQSIHHWSLDYDEPMLTMEQNFFYAQPSGRLDYIISSFTMPPEDRFWDMKVAFTWDAMGRVIEVMNELGMAGSWYPFSRTTVSYLPQDQSNYDSYYNFLIKQLTFGDHELHHQYSNMLVYEELEYGLDDETMEWWLSGKHTYSYDASFNMLQSQNLEAWGEGWNLVAQQNYTYDTFGNPLTWTSYNVYDSNLEPEMRRLNTYSEVTSNEDNVNPVNQASIQVYPNPFNPETNIAFELSISSLVSLDIYNLKGQKVRNLISEVKPAGTHQIVFNGTDDKGRALNSGIYFARLSSNDGRVSRKLILQK